MPTEPLADIIVSKRSSLGGRPRPDSNLADQYNTVRKMGCKRAHIAAMLFVTCASEIFTQDLEDNDSYDQSPDDRWEDPQQARGQHRQRGAA